MTNDIPTPEEGDDVLRICPLVDTFEGDPHEGSEKRTCDDCGAEVWFDTNQITPPTTITACTGCGFARVAREGGYVMNVGDEPFEIPPLIASIEAFLREAS